MAKPVIDLHTTHLYADGADLVRVSAAKLWPRLMDGTPGGPEAERVARGDGWLITLATYDADWPHWEMHPEGDEVVHFAAGDVEFVLDDGRAERRVRVAAGQTLVVPRGAWHRAIVHEPGEALHITFGRGTDHRPL